MAKTRVHGETSGPVASLPQKTSNHLIGTLMRLTLAGLREKLSKRLAVEDIPWSAWYFLRALWEEDGLTQGELTARVGMRQPTTVGALQTMERLNLVHRQRDSGDRRKLRIFLTDKGRLLRETLLPDVVTLNNDVALKDFSDKDILEFNRLLIKMHRNLTEATDAPDRR